MEKINSDILHKIDNGFLYNEYEQLCYRHLVQMGRKKLVEPTTFAYGNGVFEKKIIGKIVSLLPWHKKRIIVKLRGHKTATGYWIGFWKPVERKSIL